MAIISKNIQRMDKIVLERRKTVHVFSFNDLKPKEVS